MIENENTSQQDSKGGEPTKVTYHQNHRRVNLATIALIILASLTAFNTLSTLAANTGITQFPGASLFNISAQYQYGPSPNGAVLLPGDNVNFTLTIQNSAHHANNLLIFFNATNPGNWTMLIKGTTSTIQTSIYTMTLNGQTPIAPINQIAEITSITFAIQPGMNTVKGTITASNTATIGDSFGINWFGQPV